MVGANVSCSAVSHSPSKRPHISAEHTDCVPAVHVFLFPAQHTITVLKWVDGWGECVRKRRSVVRPKVKGTHCASFPLRQELKQRKRTTLCVCMCLRYVCAIHCAERVLATRQTHTSSPRIHNHTQLFFPFGWPPGGFCFGCFVEIEVRTHTCSRSFKRVTLVHTSRRVAGAKLTGIAFGVAFCERCEAHFQSAQPHRLPKPVYLLRRRVEGVRAGPESVGSLQTG